MAATTSIAKLNFAEGATLKEDFQIEMQISEGLHLPRSHELTQAVKLVTESGAVVGASILASESTIRVIPTLPLRAACNYTLRLQAGVFRRRMGGTHLRQSLHEYHFCTEGALQRAAAPVVKRLRPPTAEAIASLFDGDRRVLRVGAMVRDGAVMAQVVITPSPTKLTELRGEIRKIFFPAKDVPFKLALLVRRTTAGDVEFPLCRDIEVMALQSTDILIIDELPADDEIEVAETLTFDQRLEIRKREARDSGLFYDLD